MNFLTVEDLFQLKVTNQLHHLSIKRGVQVTPSPAGDPPAGAAGARLPAGGAAAAGEPGERDSLVATQDVVFWTNHR